MTFPFSNLTYTFNHYEKTNGIFLGITHYLRFRRYMVWTYIEISSKQGSHLDRKFSLSWNTAENAWNSYHAGKNVFQPLDARIVPFFIIKRCRTNNWHATSSNKIVLNLQTPWILSKWQQLTVWTNQYMPLANKSNGNIWNLRFQSTFLCLEHFALRKNY